MNKKTYLAILVLLLVAISYYLINKKPWGINYKDIADFAIADTSAIDKIFIADRNGNTVILEKKGPQTWTINNNKMADFSKMEYRDSSTDNSKITSIYQNATKEENSLPSNYLDSNSKTLIY